jgi:hypothetical protein
MRSAWRATWPPDDAGLIQRISRLGDRAGVALLPPAAQCRASGSACQSGLMDTSPTTTGSLPPFADCPSHRRHCLCSDGHPHAVGCHGSSANSQGSTGLLSVAAGVLVVRRLVRKRCLVWNGLRSRRPVLFGLGQVEIPQTCPHILLKALQRNTCSRLQPWWSLANTKRSNWNNPGGQGSHYQNLATLMDGELPLQHRLGNGCSHSAQVAVVQTCKLLAIKEGNGTQMCRPANPPTDGLPRNLQQNDQAEFQPQHGLTHDPSQA